MKKIYFNLLFAIGITANSFAQDCSGNRFSEQIFTDVSTTLNVKYGSALNQTGTTTVELFLDIYTPSGDMYNDRPVVLLAHGGSFIGGSKSDMADMCENLAKMGYVAVSMQYRLLDIADPTLFVNIGLGFQKEVVRAMHDMKAAIRFLRKSAIDNGNPYGINPDLIIVGGSSAGAILANHVTYLDQMSKVPTALTTYVNDQGGLEGNSGNSGFSSVPQMVVSMCGAIMDTTWMEPGDQPYVGIHNLGDNVVPNLAGQPNVGLSIPVTLMGDSLMYKRSLTVGITSAYKSYPGDAHCDFPASSAKFLTDFMYEQICLTDLSALTNGDMSLVTVYPNPTKDLFYIDVPANNLNWTVSIVNTIGQEVLKSSLSSIENRLQVEANSFHSGIYLVKLKSENGKEVTRKIVVQ